MEIGRIDSLNNFELPTVDLLNYLAQVMLAVVDSEIKDVSEENNKFNKSIQYSKQDILNKKEELNKLSFELSRKKQINIILNLIQTLYREGGLLGQNKSKVIKLLDEIEGKDYHALQRLEQRLNQLKQSF